VSETAARKGIDNTPNDSQLQNIILLANHMQDIRGMLDNNVIIITSGFRSPKLNSAIGGSKTSAHMDGLAADFVCHGFGSPFEVATAIYSHMPDLMFDQLINEFGRWVHIGFPRDGEPARRQLLTAVRGSNGATVYQYGLHEVNG
jgi:hypothetical protein